MILIDIHWGWITPGVGQANRRLQLDRYLDILESRAARDGDRFYFTQPGWLLDLDQSDAIRRLTTASPERGKADGPMRPDQLDRFRAAVRSGQLVYVAYPYSGAVVEGMTGEAVLKAMRLSREIATRQFGIAPAGFFVHDGPFQLDWNAPAIPQLGRLAGYDFIFGKNLAVIASADGTRLPMIGQPPDRADLLFTGTEAPHLPVHQRELEDRFGALTCATADQVDALIARDDLPVMSAEAIRTKGWYGGAPLVMQQQAALRRADLGLALLGIRQALDPDRAAVDLIDLWKTSLILQDCHLQWLLADLDAHYLPLARQLEAEVRQRLAVASEPQQSTPRSASAGYTLENSRLRIELGPAGEILSVRDRAGATLYTGRANQVRHWTNQPASGEFVLRQMSVWDEPFSGNIQLETEVEVSADGSYPLFLDIVRGLAVAVAANDDDWTSATNRHWGGGLPSGNQEHGYSQTADLALRRGRNRIVLHAVADDGFKLRAAVVRCGDRYETLQYWQGRKVLEWVPDPFVVDAVESREENGRAAAVTFRGRFATCAAELTVALAADSDRVDVSLTRTYAERVHEGLPTLPLPPEIGSYLGSYCERPYVPAFTVEHRVPRQGTTYTSDKPYGFALAEDSDRAWNTGRFRELYGGLAPFLGIFTAIAESPDGSLAMLTDGHGHFFRRRPLHDPVETLGLSLGSTILHPMTQNYRIPRGSPFEKIGRSADGVDYEDSHETCAFICPTGALVCCWSLLFDAGPTLSRRRGHEQLHDWLFPGLDLSTRIVGGVHLEGDEVILAGGDADGDRCRLRLVNLVDHPQTFTLELPFAPASVAVAADLPLADLVVDGRVIRGTLPPRAMREFELRANETPPPNA